MPSLLFDTVKTLESSYSSSCFNRMLVGKFLDSHSRHMVWAISDTVGLSAPGVPRAAAHYPPRMQFIPLQACRKSSWIAKNLVSLPTLRLHRRSWRNA